MSTRPTRHAPPPPPAANALYCHTCGRIITPHSKPHPSPKNPSTPQKYCSDRCRRSKPRPDTNNTGTSLETLIERTFVRLLSEKRIVECGEVEREVFGWGDEGGGGGGNSSNSIEEERRMEAEAEADGDDNEEEDNNDDEGGGGGVPLPPCSSTAPTSTSTPTTNINIQLNGRRGEEEDLTPQQRGIRKAKEREMVRQAGRRGVAFGFEVEGARARRKVDCVRGGRVVESSFAKGEWGVKWRG